METAERTTSNRRATMPGNRAQDAVGPNRPCSFTRGCEARKIPAVAPVFFLDFPFYRTYQDLALWSVNVALSNVSGFEGLGVRKVAYRVSPIGTRLWVHSMNVIRTRGQFSNVVESL